MTLQKKWEREYAGLRAVWKVRSKAHYLAQGILQFETKKK